MLELDLHLLLVWKHVEVVFQVFLVVVHVEAIGYVRLKHIL
jgi:hypothetical protein